MKSFLFLSFLIVFLFLCCLFFFLFKLIFYFLLFYFFFLNPKGNVEGVGTQEKKHNV